MTAGTALLKAANITAGYRRNAPVLRDVSVEIAVGDVVTVLGANGAGKTTLLRALMNALPWCEGTVELNGSSTRGRATHTLVHDGLVLVPESRALMPFMSVRENLQLGLDVGGSGGGHIGIAEVLELFPVLDARKGQKAGSLSGGEQQMLAIARALLAAPRCLLLDEPSQGLAPKIVAEVFQAVSAAVTKAGVGLILIEQNVEMALSLARRGYLLQRGRIVFAGDADDLRRSGAIESAYLT